MGTRPCGCPLDVGRTFRATLGIGGTRCNCCGSFEVCVKLPVGAGYLMNCVHCLNPVVELKPKLGTRKIGRGAGKINGMRSVREEHFPASLRHALEVDTAFPLTNDHPSAQRQKALQNAKESYDE